MLKLIRKKYRAWSLENKLSCYEAHLDGIDDGNCRLEEFPIRLKELWRTFDISLLENITIRDVLGHTVLLRHKTFGQLYQMFIEANDAIAHENDNRIDYITRTGMGQQSNVPLDNYFTDPDAGHLTVAECYSRIRLLLIAHAGILENIEGTYSQRRMLHVYYDILQLTNIIIHVIEKKEFANTA